MSRKKYTRRRPRGHVRQRGEHSWEVRAELPPDPQNQRRRLFTCTVRGTRADAERKLTEVLAEIDAGKFTPPAKDTVGDYLNLWLVRRIERGGIEDSTVESYRHLIDDILVPRLGRLKVVQVSPERIDALISDLLRGDALHAEAYSKSTVRKVHMVLRGALKLAKRNGAIEKNAAEDIELPRQQRQEREIWSLEQAQEFMRQIADDMLYVFYLMAALVGPRRGELAGLRWHRVHIRPDGSGHIEILQQIRMVKGKPQLAKTKTQKSTRTVPLPAIVVEALEIHRARQAEQAKKFNWQVTEDSFVFTRNDGRAVRPDSVYQHFELLIRKHGLPRIALHDLRHTFASLVDETGGSAREKADIMGHTTTQMGDIVYTHTSENARQRAVNNAAEAFQRGFAAPSDSNFGSSSAGGES